MLWDDGRVVRGAPAWKYVFTFVLWPVIGISLFLVRTFIFMCVAVPLFGLCRVLKPGSERHLLAAIHPLLGIWLVRKWKETDSIYYRDFHRVDNNDDGGDSNGDGDGYDNDNDNHTKLKKKKKKSGSKSYTPIVVCNHQTDYDFVVFQYRPFGVLVSPYWKKMDEWCLKWGADMGLIYARSTAAGNSQERSTMVREAIREHLKYKRDVPLLVFPEGGTTNGTGVMRFNKFVFSLGEPVLPVAIRVHKPFLPLRVDCLRDSFLSNVFFTTFQPMVKYEATFLPAMQMTDEEMKAGIDGEGAVLFANRVQQAIADELGIPASDKTYQDKNRLRQNWNPGWF